MADMRIWMVVSSLVLVFASQAPQSQEAPTGFDGKSNGLVDDQTHQADQVKFDEVEGVADGLGPVYNAQSCGECHQNPTTGGISQVVEQRAGRVSLGVFYNPAGGSLIHSRATDAEIQEHMPNSANINTFRASANTLGDG